MFTRASMLLLNFFWARRISGDQDRELERIRERRLHHKHHKSSSSPFLTLERAEIIPTASPPEISPVETVTLPVTLPPHLEVSSIPAAVPTHNASAEVWHLYYANPRAASLFLSTRIDTYGSGRVRYEPRMFTEEAEVIFPKTGKRYHTSNGYVATKVMFLVPPPLYLDLVRQGREDMDFVIHDPRVIPIVAANEFCEGFFHYEDWPAPALKQYWDGDGMRATGHGAGGGLALYSSEEQKKFPTLAAWGDHLWGSGVEDATAANDEDQMPWYLPLGPRYEFRIVQPEEVKPPTGRRFLFNMMTSLSTNTIRIALDATVRSFVAEEETGGLSAAEEREADNRIPLGSPSSRLLPRIGEAFVHNTDNWAANLPTNVEAGQALPSEKYRDVLLDSVFTLSPSGHNPETFRLFEAAEAGSIPIVDYTGHGNAGDDDGGGGRSGSECADPWRPFLDSGAPFIWVEDWTGLEALLERLRSDPEALARRQQDLSNWLKAFMRGAVGTVERAIASHKQRHAMDSLLLGSGKNSSQRGKRVSSSITATATATSGKSSSSSSSSKSGSISSKNTLKSTLRGKGGGSGKGAESSVATVVLGGDGEEEGEALHIADFAPRWINGSDGASFLENVPSSASGAIIATGGRAEAHAVAAYLGDCGVTSVFQGANLNTTSAATTIMTASNDAAGGSVAVVTWLVAGGAQALGTFFAKQQVQVGRLQQGKVLVHLVRHPLRSIEGTLGEGEEFWAVVRQHLKGSEYAKPNKMMKSIRYWLDWNRVAERHASMRLRVEDIREGPSKLLRYLTPSMAPVVQKRRTQQHRHLLSSSSSSSSSSSKISASSASSPSEPLSGSSYPECPAHALSAGVENSGGSGGGGELGVGESRGHTQLTWASVQKSCGLRVFREVAVAAVKYGYGDDLPNKGAGDKLELAKKNDKRGFIH